MVSRWDDNSIDLHFGRKDGPDTRQRMAYDHIERL